jgi:hypothetical protein
MKNFKKKHFKLPREAAVVKLLHKTDPLLVRKWERLMEQSPDILPRELRAACLAQFDPGRRTNIRYFPDLHNFQIYDLPNRSLPIEKFLTTFKPFIGAEKVVELQAALTDYRLVFHTAPDDWVAAYANSSVVSSCQANTTEVKYYAHPQNKLALAALYAPSSSTLIARTIVNLEEKWWVRLFGDKLLLDKLQEMGYRKGDRPREFRMYAYTGREYNPTMLVTPYFDFSCTGRRPLPETHDPGTGLVEIIVNEGIT